jgi:hypothetical protein
MHPIEIHVHKDFIEDQVSADIAIIKLSEDLEFSAKVI